LTRRGPEKELVSIPSLEQGEKRKRDLISLKEGLGNKSIMRSNGVAKFEGLLADYLLKGSGLGK